MSIYGIREFVKLKESWIKQVVELKLLSGLLSSDTVQRTLDMINPVQF